MLNYLKAELYKLLHQRAFCVSLSLLLILEGMLVVLQRLIGTWEFNRAVMLLCGGLSAGFFLIYPLGTLVFSEQYKHNTLKNEIFFGIPRSRIYLGKLFAAAIVCIVTCVLAIGFYLGFSWFAFPKELGQGLNDSLLIMGYCLLIALPVWLGALSLLHMLQFSIKSTTLFTILYIACFVVLAPMVWLFESFPTDGLWQSAVHALSSVLLTTPLNSLSGNLTPVLYGAWLVGMGWLAVTTALGLFVFHKKDIK